MGEIEICDPLGTIFKLPLRIPMRIVLIKRYMNKPHMLYVVTLNKYAKKQ